MNGSPQRNLFQLPNCEYFELKHDKNLLNRKLEYNFGNNVGCEYQYYEKVVCIEIW